MSLILGISSFYHDSAAAIILDGKIIAAAQEERFTRIKHDSSFPDNAIKFCLQESKKTLDEVNHIVFYEKPFLKFERLIETYVQFAPFGFLSFIKAMPIWLKEKIFQKKIIFNKLKKIDSKFSQISKIKFCEHHSSHAASAFYPSPFQDSAILTLDGVGEWTTTAISHGTGNQIKIIKEIYFPHSIGLLYSAFTYYLGFRVNSGEYKVMGLAPYGDPKYCDLILEKMLNLNEDGSFLLNMDYFGYATSLIMTNNNFSNLFNLSVRKENDPLLQIHMDIAASIQKVIEIIILKIVKFTSKTTNSKNLCLAGGVALNCVSNSKILNSGLFDNVWVQPAAGDAGGALGCALAYYYQELNYSRNLDFDNKFDSMSGAYLGPEFSTTQVKKQLDSIGATYSELTEKEIYTETAKQIYKQKAVGWFQGKMEFGPRALGNRSILADPRSSNMQKNLNLKIKYRESFRPFAPAVLKEELSSWFNLSIESPYMLFVAEVNENKKILSEDQNSFHGLEKLKNIRSLIPAVTHVDFSARVQTVDKNVNEVFYKLISEFFKLSGCPMLINTSFNVRGEPIVCTPLDAYRCFMGTELDILVCNNLILYKEKQNISLLEDYKDKFELD